MMPQLENEVYKQKRAAGLAMIFIAKAIEFIGVEQIE